MISSDNTSKYIIGGNKMENQKNENQKKGKNILKDGVILYGIGYFFLFYIFLLIKLKEDIILLIESAGEVDSEMMGFLCIIFIVIIFGKIRMRKNGIIKFSDKIVQNFFKFIDYTSLVLSVIGFVLFIIFPARFINETKLVINVFRFISMNNHIINIMVYVFVFYVCCILIEFADDLTRFSMFILEKIIQPFNEIKELTNPIEKNTLLIAYFALLVSVLSLFVG